MHDSKSLAPECQARYTNQVKGRETLFPYYQESLVGYLISLVIRERRFFMTKTRQTQYIDLGFKAQTYRIGFEEDGKTKHIHCFKCSTTSCNPNDIKFLYCHTCLKFHKRNNESMI